MILTKLEEVKYILNGISANMVNSESQVMSKLDVILAALGCEQPSENTLPDNIKLPLENVEALHQLNESLALPAVYQNVLCGV